MQARDDAGWANALDHIYVERNIIEAPTDDIFNDFYLVGFAGLTGEPLTDLVINDNTLFYTVVPTVESSAIGIKVQYATGVIIDGNTLYNGPPAGCNGGIILSNEIATVTISNNFVRNWYEAINITSTSVDGDISIYGNIINTLGNPIRCNGAGTINGDIDIYDNTILTNDDLGTVTMIDFGSSTLAAGQFIRIKNNIIGNTAGLDYYDVSTPATITGTFDCDYNLYWNNIANNQFKSLGVDKTWAQWLGLGYEANTPNVTKTLNPIFTNGSGLYNIASDFALGALSPAINAGVNTGVTLDYYGLPRVEGTEILGSTTIYTLTSHVGTRRAVPVTFAVDGEIESISMYHNGGTGNLYYGVYEDLTTAPTTRLGVTASTALNIGIGWQTINLTSPVTVTPGQTVWLAWVFQTNPGIRYVAGAIPRAESADTWAGGMPDPFGAVSTYANNSYSLYCKYKIGSGIYDIGSIEKQ